MIHEATNGIQSLDLLSRKMLQKDNQGLLILVKAIQQTVNLAKDLLYGTAQKSWLLHDCTLTLMRAGADDIDLVTSNSHVYSNMVRSIVIAWKWLEMETIGTRSSMSMSRSQATRILLIFTSANYLC